MIAEDMCKMHLVEGRAPTGEQRVAFDAHVV